MEKTFVETRLHRLGRLFMNLKKLSVIALITLGSAFAQESTGKENSSTESTGKVLSNKTKGDIDNEITNARMRAASGSKSKFSGSLSAFYDGGSIEKPLSATRPNLSGDPEVPALSEGGGSLSLRYRVSKNHSFTFGAGFSFFQPFQSSDKYAQANEFQITNPSLGYSFIGKVLGFQTSSSVSFTYGTWDGWENITAQGTNLDYSVGLSQTFTKAFEGTGFSAGLSFSVGLPKYSDSLEDNLNRYTLGIFPFAEYQISDKFVARTVFGYFNFRNKRRRDKGHMVRAYEYQSVGIGWVASRDVWIYPNIQFIPDNLDIKNTNVGVSATINMF